MHPGSVPRKGVLQSLHRQVAEFTVVPGAGDAPLSKQKMGKISKGAEQMLLKGSANKCGA